MKTVSINPEKLMYWINNSYSDTKPRQKTTLAKKLETSSKSSAMNGKTIWIQEKEEMESTFIKSLSVRN